MKLKIFLVSLVLYSSFMVSAAETLDGINVFIIDNSEMSMQTTISYFISDPTLAECIPSSAQYNVAVVRPRSSGVGMIRTNGADVCELDISTFIDGNTCFVRFRPSPSRIELIIPSDLGQGICNRITYRYID